MFGGALAVSRAGVFLLTGRFSTVRVGGEGFQRAAQFQLAGFRAHL